MITFTKNWKRKSYEKASATRMGITFKKILLIHAFTETLTTFDFKCKYD